MKNEDSEETDKTFSKLITKKKRQKKFWAEQGTDVAGEFTTFCSAGGIESYSTKNETKAALTDRTKRSLKNNLHRYVVDYGYKFIHKLPHFIATMNSRSNRSKDVKPNHAKNSVFMSIL